MDKYVLVKCQFSVGAINSCCISGMNLEEICYILDAPLEMLLTYNEFDTICRLKKEEFLKFIHNRRDYYDIVCSDINENFAYKPITIQNAEDLLNFADVCTPNPVLWLPSIANSFCIYSHDESLYSYMCFKMKPDVFASKFLNYVIFSLTNAVERQFEQTDLIAFLNALQKGIYINTEYTKMINNTLCISASYFDDKSDFSNNLYSEQFHKFVSIKLRSQVKRKTGDSSVSSPKKTE